MFHSPRDIKNQCRLLVHRVPRPIRNLRKEPRRRLRVAFLHFQRTSAKGLKKVAPAQVQLNLRITMLKCASSRALTRAVARRPYVPSVLPNVRSRNLATVVDGIQKVCSKALLPIQPATLTYDKGSRRA
jgi:hypothetical protein